MTHQTPTYAEGAPCWAGLSTPDLAGARRFYGALLGWTFEDPNPALGGYVNARLHDRRVAGLMVPMPGQDSPPAWGVWLKSSDLEATERAALAAGGAALYPAHDVGDLGRMLLLRDPTGAVFGAWQPRAHIGSQLWAVPGAPCWAEVYTRDGAATDRFYRDLFAYTQQRAPAGTIDYSMYSRDGAPVCGRLTMTDAWQDIPPHWLIYFAVEDVRAALTTVDAEGGKVLHGPLDSPHGPYAFIKDPWGAVFAVIQRAADDQASTAPTSACAGPPS